MKKRERRIRARLEGCKQSVQEQPMFGASNIHYDVSDRSKAVGAGGIGLMHSLARRVGLIDMIDRDLEVLKVHKPYHESDHVLNIAYSALAGGTRLEDIELLRNDESYLDMLGADTIPDPTTAGDFCRRFDHRTVDGLQDVFNEVRLGVWKNQPDSFFEEAIIEADGTLVPSTGKCKEGMAFSYKGDWSYHVLLVSLRNTAEPLYLVNRSGNRPSHEGAPERFEQAVALCERAGFRKVSLRGDTDFSLTSELDGWDDRGVGFVFGFDARANLVAIAEKLPKTHWKRLRRPEKHEAKSDSRTKPENEREKVVEERGYTNLRLRWEDVAEFEYQPTSCRKSYRMVALRKRIDVRKGQERLWEEYRYFFYITNETNKSVEEIVFESNARCDQENLIEQLKNGVRSLRAPSNTLVSNWAYMVMASLAWSLKAWFALMLPEDGRWKKKHTEEKKCVLRMEFKSFLNAFIRIPAQVVRGGRKILLRLLSWNPWQHIFLRAVEAFERPISC